jgi:hypothetical protein
LIKQARSAAFFEAFVKRFLRKKWGILIKKESESRVFTGLEIPRDYYMRSGGIFCRAGHLSSGKVRSAH